MILLKEKNCRIAEGADNWKDAVRLAVKPLEEDGDVEPRYKEEIVKNAEELGPYFILAPKVAMPHARPEQGALRTQIAVTRLKKARCFQAGRRTRFAFDCPCCRGQQQLCRHADGDRGDSVR